MKIYTICGLLVCFSTLSLVAAISMEITAASSRSAALPGQTLSINEAENIYASATIHGNCVNGSNCVGAGPPCGDMHPDFNGCVNEGSVCGTCSGSQNQTCTAAETEYLCVDDLPLTACCTLTAQCRWNRTTLGTPICVCQNIPAFSHTFVTRRVC